MSALPSAPRIEQAQELIDWMRDLIDNQQEGAAVVLVQSEKFNRIVGVLANLAAQPQNEALARIHKARADALQADGRAVKPLEWIEGPNNWSWGFQASSSLGLTYRVWPDGPMWRTNAVDGLCANEGEAKAAAQADYARLRTAALSAVTVGQKDETVGYVPQIIEYEEGGYAQLVLEDTAMIVAEFVTVQVMRRLDEPREIIGFQWDLPLKPHRVEARNAVVERAAEVADQYAAIWRRGHDTISSVRVGAAVEIASAIRALGDVS